MVKECQILPFSLTCIEWDVNINSCSLYFIIKKLGVRSEIDNHG